MPVLSLIHIYNGSGKTVLFKSICGFLSCDEGTITVNGKVMGKDKDMPVSYTHLDVYKRQSLVFARVSSFLGLVIDNFLSSW